MEDMLTSKDYVERYLMLDHHYPPVNPHTPYPRPCACRSSANIPLSRYSAYVFVLFDIPTFIIASVDRPSTNPESKSHHLSVDRKMNEKSEEFIPRREMERGDTSVREAVL